MNAGTVYLDARFYYLNEENTHTAIDFVRTTYAHTKANEYRVMQLEDFDPDEDTSRGASIDKTFASREQALICYNILITNATYRS